MADTAAAPQQDAWDPAQYLRFGDERLRPALDMIGRIPLAAPKRVVDLGCGPGNVTTILKQRYPGADVMGLDGSAAMLEKARAAAPDCRGRGHGPARPASRPRLRR